MAQSGEATGISRLTSLPVELLSHILECLVPEHPEIGETRPVQYDKLVPGEAWYDITRSRHGLRSLCLTSSLLRTMAQPLLYRVVFILDEESMLLLFRTLTERPDLGNHTRYLSCHITLTRMTVIRDVRRAITRTIKTFQPDYSSLRQDYPAVAKAIEFLIAALPYLNAQAGDFDDMPQLLLFFIVSFTKRLETLMLQVPICDDHPEYTAWFERITAMKSPPMRDAAAGEPSSSPTVNDGPSGAAGDDFLRHVKTLLLQGDPELREHFEGDNCDCDVPELWGVQARRYWPLFNALRSLTTVEVSCDDGVWYNLRSRRAARAYLEGVKHLYLHNSIASPRDLYHVLINAPNLRTLYMTPRRDVDLYLDPEAEGPEAHPEALDAALMRQPKQLRHLDIGWVDCTGNELLIGPEGRLASLPHLVKLEKLCVQLAVLYGKESTALFTPMSHLLPPSLVELTLEEWWWGDHSVLDDSVNWLPAEQVVHYQTKGEYRAMALMILSRFAVDCAQSADVMPRLRKVTFQVKIPWTWRMDGFVTTESHFKDVNNSFRNRGIDFLVEEV